MAGAGTMSAGLGPAGIGTPIPGSDPAVGPAGTRYLNPITKDYEQDPATGQLAQMPSVRQRFLILLSTSLASSSVQQGLGIDPPRKIDSKFKAAMEHTIRAAVTQLTDIEQVARIDSITIETGVSGSATGRARTTVSFTDLTTGKQDSVNI